MELRQNLKTMIITKSTTVAFTGYRASKILAPGQAPKEIQTLQPRFQRLFACFLAPPQKVSHPQKGTHLERFAAKTKKKTFAQI